VHNVCRPIDFKKAGDCVSSNVIHGIPTEFSIRNKIGTQFKMCSNERGSAVKFIYEISSSHGGEYDVQSCLLGYAAV
jgi:hypothetical protein